MQQKRACVAGYVVRCTDSDGGYGACSSCPIKPGAHNAAGEIDRWGSKYEELVLGVCFSLSG